MAEQQKQPPQKKLVIVDGYNVLRSGSRYVSMRNDSDFTHDTFNHVREALISDVAAFIEPGDEAVIVFDAANNDASAGKIEKISGVKIIFSPFGSSADKVIEKLAHEARENQTKTLVVTSDATIQDTVFGGGVDRMSANGFSLEMESVTAEVQQSAEALVSKKNTLQDRISPEAAAQLAALRDSLS